MLIEGRVQVLSFSRLHRLMGPSINGWPNLEKQTGKFVLA